MRRAQGSIIKLDSDHYRVFVTPPQTGSDKPRYDPETLDAEDVDVYLWNYHGTEIEAAVLLAIGGGFRRGEICALNWEDINPITYPLTS